MVNTDAPKLQTLQNIAIYWVDEQRDAVTSVVNEGETQSLYNHSSETTDIVSDSRSGDISQDAKKGGYSTEPLAFNVSQYSEQYVASIAKDIVNQVKVNFHSLIGFAVEDNLHIIVRIKKALYESSQILLDSAAHRQLFSILLMITDNYSQLDDRKLKLIDTELERFNGGSVMKNDLDIFRKQLYRNGIRLLSSDE